MAARPLLVCLVLGLLAGAGATRVLRAQAQRPASSVGDDGTPQVDPRDAQIAQFKQEVLERDSEIAHLKAEFATCEATAQETKRQLQSVTLSDDVVKLLARYHDLFGGEWTWDNDQRRIVPAKAKEKP